MRRFEPVGIPVKQPTQLPLFVFLAANQKPECDSHTAKVQQKAKDESFTHDQKEAITKA